MTVAVAHHPHDDLLLERARGTLPVGQQVVLGAHLEFCAACRGRARLLDALGGHLVDEAAPLALAHEALQATWARIHALSAPVRWSPSPPPPLPQGTRWPRALARARATPWRWIAPGMRWSRLTLAEAPSANLVLLRIAPGRYLPRHTHRGLEFTQVLHGSFHDGRALFGPGDFDAADASIHHQPVVQEGSDCICLAHLQAPLRFDGLIARAMGSLIGL